MVKKLLPRGWRLTRFDEIMARIDRCIVIDDIETYKCLGVRWYGLGGFVRVSLPGAQIRRKKQWLIEKGDVVYNKLFAWKGAFALADEEVDGCIASDKFPTYTLDLDLVDPKFLEYFFRTEMVAEQAVKLSKGAAAISKLTLNPPQFWDLNIPLPKLTVQRQIVARIEQLTAQIQLAQDLRQESDREADALFKSVLERITERVNTDARLQDVFLAKPRNGWSARCDNSEDGTPVLSLSAVTGFKYNPFAYKRTSLPTSPDAEYWLNDGDLLITRSNTPELVGHAAIYDGTPHPCIYPDLIMRLKVDNTLADKRFVWYWLQTPLVREYIQLNTKGTSPTMQKISQGVVMNIPFCANLSLSEQHSIIAYLDQLQAEVNELKKLQSDTRGELEVLLPSILDKAFKGQL